MAAMVKGVVCPKGHFNPPRVLFCRMCGISMAHEPHDRIDGPRLPVGVLVLDDGSIFSVDDDYVLGRDPESDPEVLSGRARPLVLRDEGLTVSPIHAAIRMREWEAYFVDRGSVQGTAVRTRGARGWRLLACGEAVVLTGGTSFRLGCRTLSYSTLQRC
jgi:hypothetical protein